MPNACISGTGFYVPPRVFTNEDMKQFYDTSDEWITERSGIKSRHWAEPGTGPADLAVPAVDMALAQAGLQRSDIDFIIFATLSPEAWFPGSACFMQEKMGLGTIGALDIRQQCSGFVYALSIANLYVRAGQYRHIAVVGAEVQNTSIDFSAEGRQVGVLFGDGAGAVIVSATEEPRGILSTHLHAQGRFAKELWVAEPSSLHPGKISKPENLNPYMNGREVFKNAVRRFPEVIREALDANGWTAEEVTLYIPHQANLRISQAVAEEMKLPFEKFYSNIHKYGNTTAASIPIALAEAVREGRLRAGDKLILAAFGSGFTWASAAVVW